MPLGDNDIASGVFFADFGSTVVFLSLTAKGIFEATGKDAVFGSASVSDEEYRLILGMGCFPVMPDVKGRLTVDGAPYQVRSSDLMDDGKLVSLQLRALGAGMVDANMLPANDTVGSPIASATTISPVSRIVHVTGTATIQTITPPYGASAGTIVTMIADGGFATGNSGNIATVLTEAVIGRAYLCSYDGVKWYIT